MVCRPFDRLVRTRSRCEPLHRRGDDSWFVERCGRARYTGDHIGKAHLANERHASPAATTMDCCLVAQHREFPMRKRRVVDHGFLQPDYVRARAFEPAEHLTKVCSK